jgi:hypothetical protein
MNICGISNFKISNLVGPRISNLTMKVEDEERSAACFQTITFMGTNIFIAK